MDTILALGIKDSKLVGALKAIGYNVTTPMAGQQIEQAVVEQMVDLLLIDCQGMKNAIDSIKALRSSGITRRFPFVVLCPDAETVKLVKQLEPERTESLICSASIAEVCSRVAMQLRIRKMAAVDGINKANLAELNSALKDLNARYAKEIEDAKLIQESLLPASLPSDPRFDIFACYFPLDEVGGDLYSISHFERGAFGIQVADVTGHGLAAAFIGSMIKLALSAVKEKNPAKLFEGVNKLLTPQMPIGRFVTMAAVTYDPESAELLFTRAGHPPGILVRSNGCVELTGEGFAFGFDDSSQYTESSTKLEIEDKVLLYTDGITEAQNRAGEMYGMQRLKDVSAKADRSISSEELTRLILEDFRTFTDGRRMNDDVTLVVFKRKA